MLRQTRAWEESFEIGRETWKLEEALAQEVLHVDLNRGYVPTGEVGGQLGVGLEMGWQGREGGLGMGGLIEVEGEGHGSERWPKPLQLQPEGCTQDGCIE